jgi:2-oxoglutarate ferredoxin oxidoreductase subunit gamma
MAFMQTEIIISGFGGQGTLFAGQVLAYAAMDYNKQVTWIPSYGPEMRGGTARCTVIISDEEIGSPVVKHPKAVIALNLPSVDKYEPLLPPEGIIVVNSSLIDREIKREDVTVVMLPANEIADDLGNLRLANMVSVGALLEMLPVLPMEAVKQALQDHLPERHQHTLPINFQALERGSQVAKEQLATV